MSLISLNRVSLSVAGNLILDEVDWQIPAKSRIALVGRNGAGKSSLLKLLEGDLVPDAGVLNRLNGLTIAGLPQEVPLTSDESVYSFLVKGLKDIGDILAEFHRLSMLKDEGPNFSRCQQKMDSHQAWELLSRVEMMANRLDIDTSAQMNALSGGLKRRVLLAASLIAAPDLLLLDEPTNHLDINAIEWLESYLKNWHGTLLLVTHDREFLGQVANSIVEIDRGKLSTYHCNYEQYLDRREANRLAEEKQDALFDKRLAGEEVWIRTGIQARRTRNEGRVRALKAMREEHKARLGQMAKVKSVDLDVKRSGSLVFEVKQLNYSLQHRPIIQDLSLLITRGDKIGIIGPNGCGKTTLLRLLLGEIAPDSGSVKQGTSLQVAYFDQLRRQLNENETLMKNVADGSDYVTINGKEKHVASYLRDFLFPAERFNQSISSLSGGERNRLLLAKLFAKPVNLLIMDEPTNDLDIETLELLERMLMEYPGTLLLISHDRAFINQVVSSVLVFEGEGRWTECVGGFDDYCIYKKEREAESKKLLHQSKVQEPKPAAITRQKISYKEQRELDELPKKIESLEEKIASLHSQMSTTDFYQQDEESIGSLHQQLKTWEDLLSEYYSRWESLEDRS